MTPTIAPSTGTSSAQTVHAHVMSPQVLLGVFGVLLVLTALTVAVAYIDLGFWNLPLAMTIATAKASLVALYFMHLRYDSPVNAVILLAGLVFLALFIVLTLFDVVGYQGDLEQSLDGGDHLEDSPGFHSTKTGAIPLRNPTVVSSPILSSACHLRRFPTKDAGMHRRSAPAGGQRPPFHVKERWPPALLRGREATAAPLRWP